MDKMTLQMKNVPHVKFNDGWDGLDKFYLNQMNRMIDIFEAQSLIRCTKIKYLLEKLEQK